MSRGSLSLGQADDPPCNTWHRSFHPGGGGNYVRLTFHLLQIFRNRRLPPNGREVRFDFPGQTCPDPLATLTRSTWLVRHSRFAGSIFAHNQEANLDNTVDQVSWTITHLQYKIRLTRHSQIFSDCLTHSRYRKS